MNKTLGKSFSKVADSTSKLRKSRIDNDSSRDSSMIDSSLVEEPAPDEGVDYRKELGLDDESSSGDENATGDNELNEEMAKAIQRNRNLQRGKTVFCFCLFLVSKRAKCVNSCFGTKYGEGGCGARRG